jgi:hypothetical protein
MVKRDVVDITHSHPALQESATADSQEVQKKVVILFIIFPALNIAPHFQTKSLEATLQVIQEQYIPLTPYVDFDDIFDDVPRSYRRNLFLIITPAGISFP